MTGISARTLGESQRQDTENERETCHEDRAEPELAGLEDRLESITPHVFPLFCELDNEDGILASQADKNHEADLSKDIVVHSTQPDAGKSCQHAHGHNENDAQG